MIYASGSGFGQYGPLSHRPCYDIVAQAMGGVVNLTGFPDRPPVKVGPSFADNVTGTFLCLGVLMALYHREKTGQGQQVDVSMVDTIFSLLENAIPLQTVAGVTAHRQGNIDPTVAPFDIYEARDGHVAMGVGTNRLFAVLCETIGRPELAGDPRYASNALRVQNYLPDLQAAVAAWTGSRTKAEIEEIFDKAGIPCGPVLTVKEAIDHPHIRAREMMVHVQHPTCGDIHMQGSALKFSETPGGVTRPSPLLGQHNKEVFGLSEEECEQLLQEGAL